LDRFGWESCQVCQNPDTVLRRARTGFAQGAVAQVTRRIAEFVRLLPNMLFFVLNPLA
jgi:hypothetical protein